MLFDETDQLMDPLTLISLDIDALSLTLRRCAGFFAFIIERDGSAIAGVDAIRSIPLFYSAGDGVSDSAEWVRQHRAGSTLDVDAHTEFLLAGYVTGNRTLWTGVEQIGAGELVVLREGTIERHCYIEFDHATASPRSREELTAELDGVLDPIFRRLIAYAAGRQIVVPLSGGYDSRLIVTMLKLAGYENVVCFTYGTPGNAESVVSRNVAESLGYRWLFAEYTDEEWRSNWSSSEAARFREFSSGHCSLPLLQDWLAISKLVRTGALEKDCVIVPGHAGDFIAGSHITRMLLHPFNRRKEKVVNYIIDGHFSNAPASSRERLTALRHRIADALGDDCDSDEGVARSYEKWMWKERQSKYISNSLRVYDHFGLDWWMPLWDTAFIHYWNSVPLDYRFERQFAIAYVNSKYASATGTVDGATPTELKRVKAGLRYSLKLMIPRRFSIFISAVLRWRRQAKTLRNLENHPLCFASPVPRGQLRGFLSKGYNIIGIYSKLYLDNDWGNVR